MSSLSVVTAKTHLNALVTLARGRHACSDERKAHALCCGSKPTMFMSQGSIESVCDRQPVPRPDPRDLLCAMLRSAEGGNSDSGGSEVSPSHKRRSARLPYCSGSTLCWTHAVGT